MVHGRVVHRFHNPTDEVVEAVYVYPLPDRAAVDHMEIRVGDRRIFSRVQEKREARRTFERARDEGRKAALVEQHRPNLFSTSVTNINPGETIRVVLEYVEELTYADGEIELRLPLTYVPRFVPDRAARRGAEAVPSSSVGPPRNGGLSVPLAQVRVVLAPGFEIDGPVSRSHAIETRFGERIELATPPGGVPADRDFLLSWRPRLAGDPDAAAFVEEVDGERYALLVLVPPAPESLAGQGLATETLFIIDVSGSMAGPSIDQARRALAAAVSRLRPEDRFNILRFNDESESFAPEFLQAEPGALASARSWVAGLGADGGTDIPAALARGLRMMGESRSSLVQRIVFLTDGAVGNEQEVLRTVVENLGDARLHTLGIGHAPNAYLMRKMAQRGRGLCEFISGAGEAENRVAAFFERLDRPVLSDLVWNSEGFEIEEVWPRNLPDLHAGQALLISARLPVGSAGGTVRIGGYTRDGWREVEASVDSSTPRGAGIARRWARAKVGAILDSLHEGADPESVRSDVTRIGLWFGMVTPYTSLVAVDDRITAESRGTPTAAGAILPSGGSGRPGRRALGWALASLGAGLLLLHALRARPRFRWS
jgi:Ca-activated chloride channel family protein